MGLSHQAGEGGRAAPPGWGAVTGLHPQAGGCGRAAPPGGAGSVCAPSQADPPACLARVQYEDEVLRRTVPAARRRPAWGESGLCSPSGALGPAQGQGRGKGLMVLVEGGGAGPAKFAESTEHSRISLESSRRPFSLLSPFEVMIHGDSASVWGALAIPGSPDHVHFLKQGLWVLLNS